MLRKNSKNSSRAKLARQVVSHPMDFTPTCVVKRRLRFKATAASASDVLTAASFGDLFCTTPTATSGVQLGNFVKVHSIEMWGPMASDLVPVSVSIEWTGAVVGMMGKSVRHSDTSMGSAEPAHVRSAPPAKSQASMWLSTLNANGVCTLVYPANTIVDVVYSLVLRDDAVATAVTGAVAGATAGAIYIRALNSPTSTNLVPVSNPTI